MIELEQVGRLTVSAASACVVRQGRLYVVADDDVTLRSFALDASPLEVVSLFPDAMPADEKARKKVKPDLETLAVLPDGSLLALGSGSSAARQRAAWVRFSGSGVQVDVVDCAPLFARLAREFEQLNVEGLVVQGDALVLGQRGNGAKRENALVRLDLAQVLRCLDRGALRADVVLGVERVDLGELDGVPLSLTDLALGSDGSLRFSAAAEDTEDPYVDGVCAGSVIGAIDGGRVSWSERVSLVVKIEGLTLIKGDRWALVADADDPTVMAPLFVASMRA